MSKIAVCVIFALTKFQWKYKKLQTENKFTKLQVEQLWVELNQLSRRFYVLPCMEALPYGLSDGLLKTAIMKYIKPKESEMHLKKGRNLLT